MNNKIKIRILCRNPKNFLQEIIKNRINLYNIKLNKKYLEVIILNKDISKIEKIKYLHKIKIIDYYGLSKIKYLLLKNKAFIIFVIIGLFINIIFSHIIFDIKIETPNQELKKVIIKDLKDNNISKYHFKLTSKKKNLAKANILSKEHDKIEWLEIEEHGTKYIIKVQERKINKKEDNCYPRNIVSNKTAIITKINAEEGEVLKKVNDLVSPNEILISGLIYNKEKIVSKKCARGKVLGEVWYKVKVEIPKITKKEIPVKASTYGITYKIFDKEYNLGNKYKNYKQNDYNIIDSKIIPIKFGISKYKKVKIITSSRNIENVDKYALDIAIKKINKQLANPHIINKKVLKKQLKNSKIIIDVFVAVEEDIITYEDLSSIDIEKMNQEKE